MSAVYYNDNDPFIAAWLRELIKAGQLPEGEVDERSILDVEPDDVRSFRRAHFFAGIGGWELALQLARWPDEREVWTGSPPCQPFSVAGQRKADNDHRDLWPPFHRLIAECKPSIVFGEQVAGKLGSQWLAGVRFELERDGYQVGAANLPACGVGAPHRRERLYWCALADAEHAERRAGAEGRHVHDRDDGRRDQAPSRFAACGAADGVDDAASRRSQGNVRSGSERERLLPAAAPERSASSFWDDAEWRVGADGKARRVGRQIRRLVNGLSPSLGANGNESAKTEEMSDAAETAHVSRQTMPDVRQGVQSRPIRRPVGGLVWEPMPLLTWNQPNRVGALRGFGNAIVPQVAAEFVKAIGS